MTFLKTNITSIVTCLFEILVGVLLLINPVGFTSGIIIGAGIVLSVLGIASMTQYFHTEPQLAAQSQLMAKGLILLLIGGFCALKSEWFIVTFPIITMIYGAVILMTGVIKIQWMVDALRMKRNKWFFAGISAAISIVCGAVILSSPFSSTAALWMFTGISLIVEAVFDMVSVFLVNKKVSEAEDSPEVPDIAEDEVSEC